MLATQEKQTYGQTDKHNWLHIDSYILFKSTETKINQFTADEDLEVSSQLTILVGHLHTKFKRQGNKI